MSMITLSTSLSQNVTIVSNKFIDEYMPKANGEFVKVYLYLLRILTTSPSVFSLEAMADILNCTEKDILRALKYWEQEELLVISYDAFQNISGISFGNSPVKTVKSNAKSNSKENLTPDRIKELKKQDELAQLLYITEQYLGKTLTATELQTLFYFYDELKMQPELIEYLIEYCVSHNHKSMRYIESVALAWKKDQITTVDAARNSTSRFSKDFFTILKYMGIINRNPIDTEVTYMNTWLHDYGFELDIIQEACNRTILQTGQSSFPYADKILLDWKNKNVHHKSDIFKLDEAYKKQKSSKNNNAPTPKSNPDSNRFNNFHQRNYNFDEIEKKLLNT